MAIALGATDDARALVPEGYAIRVTATVHRAPDRIVLSWPVPVDPPAYYEIQRKAPGDSRYDPASVRLSGTATGWTDTNVVAGTAYDYLVRADGARSGRFGALVAGDELAPADERGTVLLLLDDTHTATLGPELARLEDDLTGDGWSVIRLDVPRSADVAAVKSLVELTGRTTSLFILGHVAVPYSGDIVPDGHLDHRGAWPADLFYGVDRAWRDEAVNTTSARRQANRNIPGDGKYDTSINLEDVLVEIGRVDLHDLPAFSEPEATLLRRYLDKNHAYRHGLARAQHRGLIDDNFGEARLEAFAANGWRNFTAFFGAGANAIETGDLFADSATNSYLWGYGCGAGTFTSAMGVGDTQGFVRESPQIVFLMLFGSYFGDWDSPDNLMRAALASNGSALAVAWAGRPNWALHGMGMGAPIGAGAKETQHGWLASVDTYPGGVGDGQVHVALMGDPTLRLHMFGPPSALVALGGPSGGVKLDWQASVDAVAGYHVYRSTDWSGPFDRLTLSPATSRTYDDIPPMGDYVYMVRAVRLEQAPGGSYWNLSQGVRAAVTARPPPPDAGVAMDSAGLTDVGRRDAAFMDAGPLDTAFMDGAIPDAARLDASAADASHVDGTPRAAPAPADHCSCDTATGARSPGNGQGVALAVALLQLRRRRHRARNAA